MSETEKFIRESGEILRIMKQTLGVNYEPAMARTAVVIIEYQYAHELPTSLIAAIQMYRGMKLAGLPTDRVQAASVWWECNNLYFYHALYRLFDEE
jgi:hypothetical protein